MTVHEADLHDLLRDIDPVSNSIEHVAPAEHLTALRRVVEVHRQTIEPTSSRSRSSRRLRVAAIALAAVVATPLALLASLPGAASRLNLPWATSAAVLGSEVLQRPCDGSGRATRIDPASASPRLWPTSVPAGWTVQSVIANEITSSEAGCTAPSLVLADIGEDGVVAGVIRVTGPGNIHLPGDPTLRPDRVAGRPAREVVYPGVTPVGFHRWLVGGPGGLLWEVVSIGFSDSRARGIAEGLDFTTTQVGVPNPTSLSATVLYRRDGAPYPAHTSGGLDWLINFVDAEGRERQLEVRRTSLGLPFETGEIGPGTRLYRIEGHPAAEDGIGRELAHSVSLEISPGLIAWANIDNDLPAVEQMLLSLREIPANDPRLARYPTPR